MLFLRQKGVVHCAVHHAGVVGGSRSQQCWRGRLLNWLRNGQILLLPVEQPWTGIWRLLSSAIPRIPIAEAVWEEVNMLRHLPEVSASSGGS